MFVVPAVRHVLTDIMKQRAGQEEPPLLSTEAVERLQLVEERQSETRDLLGMSFVEMKTATERDGCSS
jgi:hypothetical protein